MKNIIAKVRNINLKRYWSAVPKHIVVVIASLLLLGGLGTVSAAEQPRPPLILTMPTKLSDGIFNTTIPQVKITVGQSQYDKEQTGLRQKELAEAAARTVVARSSATSRVADVGVDEKHALAQQVAVKYGIDWKLLAAVWQVESGKSMGSTRSSCAGAQGPMQFMPGTWRVYGIDGNGDGVKDVQNVYDALHGSANYLAINGANRGDIDSALYCYNHSLAYVSRVKRIMNSI